MLTVQSRPRLLWPCEDVTTLHYYFSLNTTQVTATLIQGRLTLKAIFFSLSVCQQTLRALRLTPVTKTARLAAHRQSRKKIEMRREAGSLSLSLFPDKYLISGTLMAIDQSIYPLFFDPYSL